MNTIIPGIGIDRGMHRDRKLLDLCRGDVPCMLQVPNVCRSGVDPSVPAHSNLQRHGRGASSKSHDCFAIPACIYCHAWLDSGNGASRTEKEDTFMLGLEHWEVYRWKRGLVAVVR